MSIGEKNSINYRIHGTDSSKLPVVLLHGLMGFAGNWGKIWPKLNDRRVLVLDQRGHGKSFHAPAGAYGPDEYAADVYRVLKDIGWEKAHVVGHSMGGRVALRFASTYPQICSSLTLEDSGTESNPTRIQWIRNLLGTIPTPFSNREAAKKYFDDAFKSDPMTGTFLHANLESKENGQQDWRFFPNGMIETVEKGRATDATDELKNLSIPTLIVRGSRSIEFPEDEAKRMSNLRNTIELKTVDGAGHFVHAEKPEEFAHFLLEFLTKAESFD